MSWTGRIAWAVVGFVLYLLAYVPCYGYGPPHEVCAVVGSGTVHSTTIVRDRNGGTIRYETFMNGRAGRGWHKTDPDWINDFRRTPQSRSSARTAEQDMTSQEVKPVPGMIINPYAQPQSSRRESRKESNVPRRQGSAAWIVNPYCKPGPAQPD